MNKELNPTQSILRDNDLAVYVDCSLDVGSVSRYSVCPFCGKEISSKGFIVQRTREGWLLYCHRCKEHKLIDKKGLSLSTVKKLLNSRKIPVVQQRTHTSVSLPADFITHIPESGIMWLNKYGITSSEIEAFNIGYSGRLNRVILPVYDRNGMLVYWQGRRLSDDKTEPKYINIRTSSRDGIYFTVTHTGAEVTVIVEDIISAIAVARAGYNTVALLGSYVNHKLHTHVTTTRVKVWLDSDKRKDSAQYSKRLRAKGFTCSSVLLPIRDPKEYTAEEIKSIINPIAGGK